MSPISSIGGKFVAMRPAGDEVASCFGPYDLSEPMLIGNTYDVLCVDGYNYLARLERISDDKKVILHFPHWAARFDYSGSVDDIYITDKGRYSSGISKLNTYKETTDAEECPKSGNSKTKRSKSSNYKFPTERRYDDTFLAKPRYNLKSTSRSKPSSNSVLTHKDFSALRDHYTPVSPLTSPTSSSKRYMLRSRITSGQDTVSDKSTPPKNKHVSKTAKCIITVDDDSSAVHEISSSSDGDQSESNESPVEPSTTPDHILLPTSSSSTPLAVTSSKSLDAKKRKRVNKESVTPSTDNEELQQENNVPCDNMIHILNTYDSSSETSANDNHDHDNDNNSNDVSSNRYDSVPIDSKNTNNQKSYNNISHKNNNKSDNKDGNNTSSAISNFIHHSDNNILSNAATTADLKMPFSYNTLFSQPRIPSTYHHPPTVPPLPQSTAPWNTANHPSTSASTHLDPGRNLMVEPPPLISSPSEAFPLLWDTILTQPHRAIDSDALQDYLSSIGVCESSDLYYCDCEDFMHIARYDVMRISTM